MSRLAFTGIAILCCDVFTAYGDPDLPGVFHSYLMEIHQAKNRGADRNEIARLNSDWKDRFMEILSTKSPQEAGWVQIASEAMALSSALGDTKAALELNKLLLDRAATDSERFSLAMNLAETQYAMWLSKAPEARVNDVRQVVDAFEYAQKLINVNYAATGKISFLLKYAAFLGQQKDPEKALQIYNNCETILLANGASVSEAWLAKDNLFEFEMKCLVDLKRNDEAIVMLQRIASLPHTQIPVSQYVNRYASYVDPQSGAKFRAIISDWLVKHPSDKGTPALENSLAESFFNAQDYAEAATWYSKLLSEPIAQPTKDDLTSGRGGIASNILHNLAICLRQLGDKEQAEALLNSFDKLFPNDPRRRLR